MKKLVLVCLSFTMFILTGCSRKEMPDLLSLNGTYQLVHFISSYLNLQMEGNNPYSDDYRQIIEIEDSVVTLTVIDDTESSTTVYVCDITLMSNRYFEITSREYGWVKKIYYNIQSGILEIMSPGSETQHYIYSKFEDYQSSNIMDGIYEISFVFGYYGNGQLATLNDWRKFEIKIKGNTIKVTQVMSDGETFEGSGTYRGGVVGFETTIGEIKEYLTYDSEEEMLKYTEKNTDIWTSEANRDYYYVFKLKA